jgi:hypothetical protein
MILKQIYHTLMHMLKKIASLVGWFTLWIAIPAASLYPFALWAAKHTDISGCTLTRSYIFAVCLLFFPTGFLVDFIYRRSFRDWRSRRRREVRANSS